MPAPESPLPDPNEIADVEAGLAAFKQGDYPRAIALLANTSLPTKHPLYVKAQMGLVVAYTRNGDPQQAITLCHALTQHLNPQVQEWAARTLANLARRHPQLAATLNASEPNLESAPEAVPPIQSHPSGDVDLTGFVPFDGSATPPDSGNVTGFVPLEQPPTEPPNAASSSAADLPASSPLPSRAIPHPHPRTPASQPDSPQVTNQPESSEPEPSEPYRPSWQLADRAKQWAPLKKVDITKLLAAQVITAIALFWVIQQMVYFVQVSNSIAISSIPFLRLPRELFGPPVWSIVILLVICGIASRCLLDTLLRFVYGLQPLSLSQMAQYSPETVQSLNRFCRQKKIPLPALGILPVSAPLSLSYGVLPRFTRIVVSRGLLEQLADDEIASVYAYEVGQISYRTVPLMSLVMVVLQIPYSLYWFIAEWGNQQTSKVWQEIASLTAALSYGIYVVLRWLGLWFSRQRTYYGDRVAAELTGNPNGFARALVKIAIGTARDVQQQGKTSYLLEGFDLLTPLGHYLGTTLGSLYFHAPLETVLAWEWQNPYRQWFSLSNSHPPTGDRLNVLMFYARYWKLPGELNFDGTLQAKVIRQQQSGFTAAQWRALLLQGAPFFGGGFGIVVAITFWILGWVSTKVGINLLAWMNGDPAILSGLPLVGFSLGTFIRINPFFPDIKLPSFRSAATTSALPTLLSNPLATPVDSATVRLEGKLLGRPGVSNMLGQDLLLQTATGLLRLHCLSTLGPVGNLFRRDVHFTDLINQDVTANGWFRRGATLWLDVDTLRTIGGRTNRGNHPVWSTILGTIAALWGIYTIIRGGF